MWLQSYNLLTVPTMADVIWKGFGAFVKAWSIPRYSCKYSRKKWNLRIFYHGLYSSCALAQLKIIIIPKRYCIRFFAVIQSTWFSPDRSVVYRYNTRGCYTHTTWCSYIMDNSFIQSIPEWRSQILHWLFLTTELLQKTSRNLRKLGSNES